LAGSAAIRPGESAEPAREMRVTHFERAPLPGGRYSIERLFGSIRAALPQDCKPTVVHCPTPAHSVLWLLQGLRKAWRRRAEVNHIVGDVHYVALALPGSRTILSVMDTIHLDSTRGLNGLLYRWFYYSWPLRRCGVITAISRSTCECLIQQFPSVAPKLRMIPACHPGGFVPHPRPFNARCPVILQVGSHPQKNLERVSEALRGIPCLLRITGHGLTPEQERIVKKHEIAFQSDVNLTDREMLQAYIDADLVVFASTGEGFGMPIVEAQAIGRPLVTSSLPPMNEIAGPGACLVDPFNPEDIRRGILEIIDNRDYRESVVAHGLRNAQGYTPEAVAASYAALYRQMAGSAQSA
jgi:glycosyltransferase involved in cell wall biosynthesis